MKDVQGHNEFNMVPVLEVIKIVLFRCEVWKRQNGYRLSTSGVSIEQLKHYMSFALAFLLSCRYGTECNELVWQACAID